MKRLILISASFLIASSAIAQSAKCVTAPVSLGGSQVTLTSSGDKSVTQNKAYIYYAHRHHKRHEEANTIAAISDKYPSKPLLLSCDKQVNTLPESYNVTLTAPQSNVTVCPDSTLKINAAINVEKVSAYTGNYPNANRDNSTYTRVSKREYKMAARKIRKIKRNENKIVRKAGMDVEAKATKA